MKSTQISSDTRPELHIATFNLRYGTAKDKSNSWQHRKDILLECVSDLSPGILAVQEALPFQLDEITRRLPGLARFGFGRYHGKHVHRIHEAYSGEHCDIFYDTTVFKLVHWNTIWHADDENEPGDSSWGNSLPRITTWGLLLHRLLNEEIAVFNTHFHWDEPYVSNAARQLVRTVTDTAQNRRYVITGDFNATPDSEAYAIITDSLTVIDTWTAAGNTEADAGTSHRFEGIPQRRIDWILVSDGWRINDTRRHTFNRNGRYPSDHFPVSARLQLSE